MSPIYHPETDSWSDLFECSTCGETKRVYHEGTPSPILRGLGYRPDFTDGDWVPCPSCPPTQGEA